MNLINSKKKSDKLRNKIFKKYNKNLRVTDLNYRLISKKTLKTQRILNLRFKIANIQFKKAKKI